MARESFKKFYILYQGCSDNTFYNNNIGNDNSRYINGDFNASV